MVAPIVQLNEHIIDSSKLVRQTLGERVKLSTAMAPDLWPNQVDPSQLRAVIVDIATRARDAMPHGGRFAIETHNVVLEEHHSDTRRSEYAQLSLTHTGPATAPADLSTADAFVKQFGARFAIESEVGGGITVNFYFPRASINTAQCAPARPPPE